jgi:hypothetical protein
MAEVDVKLGVKAILQRVEDAYTRRPDVSTRQTLSWVPVRYFSHISRIVNVLLGDIVALCC